MLNCRANIFPDCHGLNAFVLGWQWFSDRGAVPSLPPALFFLGITSLL